MYNIFKLNHKRWTEIVGSVGEGYSYPEQEENVNTALTKPQQTQP